MYSNQTIDYTQNIIEMLKKDDVSEYHGYLVSDNRRKMHFKAISKSSTDILTQNKISKQKRRASLFCFFPTTRLLKSVFKKKTCLLELSYRNKL